MVHFTANKIYCKKIWKKGIPYFTSLNLPNSFFPFFFLTK